MILNRQEFADYFDVLKQGLGSSDSPLWIPEEGTDPSNWFVCVKPIGVKRFKFSYWAWCNKTLTGKVRCYSSTGNDGQEEWWGFTNKEDIVPWMLKWM